MVLLVVDVGGDVGGGSAASAAVVVIVAAAGFCSGTTTSLIIPSFISMFQEGAMRRQETEFYAWIFGATMLTLGSLTTLTSCFAFCSCSEKWRKRRRRTKKFDKSGQYQRVDSVSSMVDSHADPQELIEQMDSVTII